MIKTFDIVGWRNQLKTICSHSFIGDEVTDVALPIHRSTTFRLSQETLDAYVSGNSRDTWLYSRYGNPTVRALERKLAAMEKAEDALATSSGMAAVSAVLFSLARPGDRWLVSRELYGVTYSLLTSDIVKMGITLSWFDPEVPDQLEAAFAESPTPRVVYFETMSNPLSRPSPLLELLTLVRKYHSTSVIDNTFASPWNCIPHFYGADFVIESGTKYLNGHSDVICGVVSGSKEVLMPVWRQMTRLGGCLDPAAAYLWNRGLQTFPLRMVEINNLAYQVAFWLQNRPEIETVFYPGIHTPLPCWLPNGGGVVAFRVAGGTARSERLLKELHIIQPATSLGGVESLISNPYNTSHMQFTVDQQAELGILPGTVRLSIGIENYTDLIGDLEQALIRSE